MAPNNSSRNRRSSAQANRRTSSKSGSKGRKQQQTGFLDDETKRSIAGVVVILLGVVLFLIAVIPNKAVASSAISLLLASVFGIGRFILPICLLLIGLTFVIRSEREHVSSRAAVGFLIIFLCLLVIVASFTEGASTGDLSHMFEMDNISALGGYVGAGIAYLFLLLFGQLITCVIMIGFIIIAIFIIGFSVNSFLNKIEEHKSKVSESFERRQQERISAREMKQGVSHLDKREAVLRRAPFGGTQVDSKNGSSAQGSAYTRVFDPIDTYDDEANAKHKTKLIDRNSKLEQSKQNSENDEQEPNNNETILQSGTKPANSKMTRKLGANKDSAEGGKKSNKSSAKSSTQGESAVQATNSNFNLPSFDLLKTSKGKQSSNASDNELRETAMRLQETIEDFGIMIEVVGWVAGPTVTLFKVSLPSGVRVNRISVLSDDIALALASPGVRIFAPIPGTNYVGIEVPNAKRQTVLLGDVLNTAPAGPLQVAVGKDVEGNSVVIDLAKAPHLLIGGTTGSGKSVAINSFIMSMLMRSTPEEVRMILVDPKRVEFTLYNGIPHLYLPVVEDPKDASAALSWGVAEMERRLKLFSAAGVRNIGQFNAKTKEEAQDAEDQEEVAPLPYIVIVIDELADLMMNVGKEVEFSISRIAQLARAAGIHLIVATQRPSANVVTGLIKSNITTRMAFTVASGIDSRVILDTTGAENLINYGDMLLSKPDLSKPQRLQACYVSEEEINNVVDFWKEQGNVDYHSEILQTNVMSLGSTTTDGSGGKVVADDPLLWEAAEIVVSAGTASTSYIQRRLSVGYSRAGRIMDMLEDKGIVGPSCGSKAREVLVDELELETLKAFEQNDNE